MGWTVGVQFLVEAVIFPPHHHVQTNSGVCAASYLMGTTGSFPGGKHLDLWNWAFISIWC